MSEIKEEEYANYINNNSRDFITENVSYIKKLQNYVQNLKEEKSETELKKSYKNKKINMSTNSKVSSKSSLKKTKAQKKKEKVNERIIIRSKSPPLKESNEPHTFIEKFNDMSFDDKSRNKNSHNSRPGNVRDVGCQYGDPKRTFYFEDGSNINLYIAPKDNPSNVLEQNIDPAKKSSFVVPSRYLLFENKPSEELTQKVREHKNKREKSLKEKRERDLKEQIQRDFRNQREQEYRVSKQEHSYKKSVK